MRYRKMTRRERVELSDRWREEIFPTMLLLIGPPPTYEEFDRDYRCRWVWHTNVKNQYRALYLQGYSHDSPVMQRHLDKFIVKYVHWIAKRRKEYEYLRHT